ncbi:hypothetical protein ACH5RR_028895 [Cinchona calisaya]|uniref:FAD-binding PCMH-type domain-containing protein n=1 Tax=Cinchona calisaya TaxID=153742 RepID=A0ABD2YRV8_9GENT
MKKSNNILLQFSFAILFTISSATSAYDNKHFLRCFVQNSKHPIGSGVISTPKGSSYSSILDFYAQNLRFTLPKTPKPVAIITPENESQIQTSIYCSKKHGLQMRILSGGHDFEGSSLVAYVPFFVLNMFNFRSISIDPKSRTAWVGSAATLGETYYSISQINSSFAFPAGYWPTVAMGGHLSGGGYGPLVRKYGLAADNVVDARIIDANGRVLDRKSMGEDLFWAIRGGTGASFGVILAYKIKIVEVSKKVTAFSVKRTLEENATKLVHKWQFVAPKMPEDLIISLTLTSVHSNQTGKRTIQAKFISVFQGGVDRLITLMQQQFPELGLTREDCIELSWVQYFAYHLGLPIESTSKILQSRVTPLPKDYFKTKSDFVQQPIPEEGLEKIWNLLLKIDSPPGRMEWTPLGARMAEIQESEIPFPHRAGNIFLVFKTIEWNGTDTKLMEERFAWIRELHGLMGQYVDNNPRGAYANYRDLDLGVNNIVGKISVEQARIWGGSYFKNNFDRLVEVKTLVDPEDYFRNEQSIPPLSSH